MKIDKVISDVSTVGLINILTEASHVRLLGDETRDELESICQLNLDEWEIDELVFIIEANGE